MVAAVAAAVLLGLWQLHVWDAARTAEARDLSDARPLALTDVMGGDSPFPGKYLGQPVEFRGEWLGAGTLYVADRDLDGRRGFWVMTPVLVGGSAMPVVRGWASTPDAAVPSGEVDVVGWLQASEGAGAEDPDPHDDVIPEMRIASIVEHVDADLYSGYVVARASQSSSGSSTTKNDPAFAGLAQVTPDSVPRISTSTSLRNLLYAVQWWVFGGFAVFIWLRWCRDTWELTRADRQVASEA